MSKPEFVIIDEIGEPLNPEQIHILTTRTDAFRTCIKDVIETPLLPVEQGAT